VLKTSIQTVAGAFVSVKSACSVPVRNYAGALAPFRWRCAGSRRSIQTSSSDCNSLLAGVVLFGCLQSPCTAAGQGGAAAAPPSGGLVNDWLRDEIPKASAWDVGGQFRTRYEVKENAGSFPNSDFPSGLDNSNDYFLFRTKAHLGWSPATWFSAYAEGRDAHAVSDARPVTETDTFDLHQAYLRLGNPTRFPLTLKLGRQELLYGDERYIGIADWSNLGRSFDAAKLRFENAAFGVDAFAGRQVLVRDDHFNVANDYDWFSGLYASTRRLVSWQDTDLYFLARNVGADSPSAITPTLGGPGPRDIYTVGTRWRSVPGKLGNWDYSFEAAGQFGSVNQGGTRREHRAFAINGAGGHTWNDAFGSPRLAIGYDFGSGDSDPLDGRTETFEPLFGTNHRLYGLMDLFGQRNMHIPRVGGSFKPVKDVTVSLEWLGFYLADTADFLYPESGAGRSQNGYGRNPAFSSFVGNELDLLVNWRVASWGQVQAGYGHFFTSDYIRQSAAAGGRNTKDADWIYLQGTFNF